jgi:hypothetical protein
MPGLAVRGTFSPARAWRPAVVARLARTLGLTKMHFRRSPIFLVASALLLALPAANGQSNQDALFQRALKATRCEQVPNNGRYCKYEFGNVLTIGIKDVGGTDTVVGFHNSNITNELYAVLYFGCIVVVPGTSHPRNYDKEYGVHISPRTGLVYKSTAECRASL